GRGYPRASRHAVRKWVIAGLLPKMVRTYHGWGPPRLSQPTVLGRQLLVLSRYRYDEGLATRDLIAANLFLDGYEVPLSAVRRAMTWADRDLTPQARRWKTRHGRGSIAAMAAALAAHPTSVAALPQLDNVE